MPEIKNTFLAGKMNKSLDDRLLPEGEYRDALNIQVTKSEGSDVGVIKNIKGNTDLSQLGLGPTYKTVGTCFDDQNNIVYWFVTNNTNSYLYKYNKNTGTTSTVLSDAGNTKLNFSTSRLIQANVIENYLFFTDGENQPRRIDTTLDYSTFTEFDISVAKPAPQFAPDITIQATSANAGNYIEEKFVRFGYRYKFSDNTYSVYSPFSNIVFKVDNNVLTEDQIKDAYSKGELDFLVNTAKTIDIQPKNPVGGTTSWDTYNIEQVDILLKSSDSPAVLIIDSIKGSDLASAFTYNSERPKSTLPENQLTRVFDNVPLKAVTQEIVGNRIVYGNFTQGFNIDTTTKLDFDISLIDKASTSTYIDYLGLKSNRNYEVGIVFSDDYGRTSPVIFGNQKSIFVDKSVQANYNKDIAITFNTLPTAITSAGFKYYSIVVKQTEQEYYNVYTPGFGNVNGKSYFSVFGDNINKIPIDTSTYNADTNINTTTVKTYLSVVNNSTFEKTSVVGEAITVDAKNYDWTNQDPVNTVYVDNLTNVLGYASGTITQTFNGYNYTEDQNAVSFSNAISPAPDGTTAVFTIRGGVIPDGDNPANGDNTYFSTGANDTENTGVTVYVNGVKKAKVTEYTYSSSTVQITFTEGNIPATGDSIVVFFEYDNIPVPPDQGRSAYSLTTMTGPGMTEFPNDTISVVVTDSNYIDVTTTNNESLSAFTFGDLQEVKITGISTRVNFNAFDNQSDIYLSSEDLYGLYKVENNYLLAEVDGLYGVEFYNTEGDFPVSKYADLAILETKPFESAIDIYYETATQGSISSIQAANDIRVKYYNCINLKTPDRNETTGIYWQESRIKGGFNEVSMDFGVQAYITNEDYGQIQRRSSLIYSGILNNNTKVNNTNQFPSGEDITRTLDPAYGSIQKLYSDTEDLLIFQEEKVSQALIDKDIIYTAEGQGLTTAGLKVISQINSYATNYGIGTNPESFAVYAGRKYFVDKPKGTVLRLSRDGLTEISNYGMRSYFREKLSGSINSIVGSWDIYNKEYVISIQGSENITLGFDESNNGWVSRYSYIPEAGGSLDGNFYTFNKGELYLHNSNEAYNIFYNATAEPSTIDLIFNQNPSANKNFSSINYEGTNTWNITSISTDVNDSGLPIAKNFGSQNDTDTLINLSVFKSFDGKYFSNIINDSSSKPEEVVFDKDISGIKGHLMKVTLENSETNYQELFAISTNYNINSY